MPEARHRGVVIALIGGMLVAAIVAPVGTIAIGSALIGAGIGVGMGLVSALTAVCSMVTVADAADQQRRSACRNHQPELDYEDPQIGRHRAE